jgi:Domain of unknown function (DU1801)
VTYRLAVGSGLNEVAETSSVAGAAVQRKATMQSKATTVEQYLAELPADRREAISTIRKVILENLPKGYEEGMLYGMIGYYVPHSLYPPGYHCDPRQPLGYACLASQKNYMSLYLTCVYCDEADGGWFRDAWTKAGKKLDMGKSCVRFKTLDDVPLKVVGQAIKRMPVKKFIEFYESAIRQNMRARESRVGAKMPASKSAAKTKKRGAPTATTAKRASRKRTVKTKASR